MGEIPPRGTPPKFVSLYGGGGGGGGGGCGFGGSGGSGGGGGYGNGIGSGDSGDIAMANLPILGGFVIACKVRRHVTLRHKGFPCGNAG